jgi:hypothetical protein
MMSPVLAATSSSSPIKNDLEVSIKEKLMG